MLNQNYEGLACFNLIVCSTGLSKFNENNNCQIYTLYAATNSVSIRKATADKRQQTTPVAMLTVLENSKRPGLVCPTMDPN